METQNTFHGHTAAFVASVCQNLPRTMSKDVMQGWIDNPRVLKKVLDAALCISIDCDAAPFIPNGWSVPEGGHQKGGILTWSPNLIQLHLDDSQQNGGCVEGHKLREKLKALPVLNANVLDFLLANPHLIPEEWKGKAVFFWGTIYRDSGGRLCVRYLYWIDGGWRWDDGWLDIDWGGDDPTALSAS